MTRREALRAAACAGVAMLSASCRRDRPQVTGACPPLAGRRLRWIVPNSAGGGYDTESRLLQPLVERALGAEIVVENQPGAGGIVGARAIVRARPDGATLGIIGVPGLLVASLMGASGAPHPARDFTILGRIGRSWHVWATGLRSGLTSLDDARATARSRPLVCALNETGSASFVSVTVAAALLGAPVEFVSGFAGTRSACLAGVRGDVDLVCYNFETIRGLVAAGDLRPLLQVSSSAIAGAAMLDGVPVLGGHAGYAARIARETGGDPGLAARAADGLADVIGGGRLLVAPPGLAPPLAACLERAFDEVLSSPELRTATRRAIDPAPAATARAEVARAAAIAPALLPDVQAALSRLRG